MYLARGTVFLQNNMGLRAYLEFAAVPFCPFNVGLMNLLSSEFKRLLLLKCIKYLQPQQLISDNRAVVNWWFGITGFSQMAEAL